MHWYDLIPLVIITVAGIPIIVHSTLLEYREGQPLREILLPISPIRRILHLIRQIISANRPELPQRPATQETESKPSTVQ